MPVILNDRIAYGNALVADIRSWVIARRGDELANYVLAFMTERTAEGIVCCALQAKSPRN
jgi:hypothetical protein